MRWISTRNDGLRTFHFKHPNPLIPEAVDNMQKSPALRILLTDAFSIFPGMSRKRGSEHRNITGTWWVKDKNGGKRSQSEDAFREKYISGLALIQNTS
jgi:hypothetical protein